MRELEVGQVETAARPSRRTSSTSFRVGTQNLGRQRNGCPIPVPIDRRFCTLKRTNFWSAMSPDATVTGPQLLTENDLYLYNEGSHYRIYDKMGAHLVTHNDLAGAVFSVWAPNARSVSVFGSFNNWDQKAHPLEPRGSSGIWEGFIHGARQG